ncbi:ubiquitin fusion degradation protein [Blastocystis sp. subtype 4]|uniref:ubiquitin fusion degradation protein n=1 Tax=Blastocystis sp. subtype 4 TaxID=944170 RepID=UPI0007113EA4|nr:ubiquitin fusion degradation protein [Blastocystis sp. subtype 4]KNB42020.1 ubiquitin fusion degradation protein [Blastocystis sp. subtype 4]|eukprot:XP_014525463.1 ubiquitin fusion degradation protein [Blastocystis sp. subtype 4]
MSRNLFRMLYSSNLRVYPIATRNPELEYGDKILLPEDAIMRINGTRAKFPLMFKIIHEMNSTYCSVKEFSAERGMCYVPRWIMKKLGAMPGDLITIRNINLRKASFVKLRFRDPSFNNLSNPRAILENKLKSFSVMARKDRIHIEHLGKEYIIDIVDCKPDVVVDIVECDVEVDIEYKDL